MTLLMKRYAFQILTLCLSLLVVFHQAHSSDANDSNENEAVLWAGLSSGKYAALLRHAIAPGFGDPSYFKVDDCKTQRNLSAEGRAQAHAIGERLRQNGILVAEVFSSQWCRCLETASLLDLGTVNELPMLNSFFQSMEKRDKQTQDLRDWLRQRAANKPTVLVTHQVNISALTGSYASSGEMIIIELGHESGFPVVGTLETSL